MTLSWNFSDPCLQAAKVKTNAMTSDGKEARVKGSGAAEGQIVMAVTEDGKIKAEWTDQSNLSANSIIKDGDITANQIADNAITGTKIADESILANDIALNAITTTKILDETISEDDLAQNSVSDDQLQNNAVSSSKIQNGAVTINKINTTELGLKECTIVVASDGTGDTNDLQDAVESLIPSSGGSVIILDGTYTIASQITLKSNLNVIGRGNVNIVNNLSGDDLFVGSNNSNISMYNLHIRASDIADGYLINLSTGNSIHIEQCSFVGGVDSQSLLNLDNIQNAIIRSNRIYLSDNTGLSISNSSNIKILDNTITGHTIGIFVNDSQYIIISANTISNNTLGNGISLAGYNSSSKIWVTDNNISDQSIGISFIFVVSDVVIDGNIIANHSDDGIDIFSDNINYISITDNIFKNNTNADVDQGASSNHIIIDGNLFDTTGTYILGSPANVTVGTNRIS